jgi:hypothetical protein
VRAAPEQAYAASRPACRRSIAQPGDDNIDRGDRPVRSNDVEEQKTVEGHCMDALIKDGGRQKFIAWAGRDDSQD